MNSINQHISGYVHKRWRGELAHITLRKLDSVAVILKIYAAHELGKAAESNWIIPHVQ